MRYANDEKAGPRRVRVPDREEVGVVVDEGKNIGALYCIAIHFPGTGEVAYYEKGRETDDGART